MTEHMTGILCLHKEKLAEQYVSKATLEKVGTPAHRSRACHIRFCCVSNQTILGGAFWCNTRGKIEMRKHQ